MNIELKMDGYCNGCECADVRIEQLYSQDGMVRNITVCDHKAACRRIKKLILNGYKDEQ